MTGQKRLKRFGDKVPYIVMTIVAIMGLAVIVASFVTLPGCASNRGYLETVTAWNDMVESYDFQYQLADPETQAKWKAEIDPKIFEANQALQAWGVAVDAETEQVKETSFINLEREIVRLLLKYGIDTEGGN